MENEDNKDKILNRKLIESLHNMQSTSFIKMVSSDQESWENNINIVLKEPIKDKERRIHFTEVKMPTNSRKENEERDLI